jgi:hypothetical protein
MQVEIALDAALMVRAHQAADLGGNSDLRSAILATRNSIDGWHGDRGRKMQCVCLLKKWTAGGRGATRFGRADGSATCGAARFVKSVQS